MRQRQAALLTAADLGQNWSQQQSEAFTTRASGIPVIDPAQLCPDAADEAKKLQDLAGDSGAIVGLRSESAGTGTSLQVSEQAWSNVDVQQFFATAKAAIGKCDGASWTMPDGAKVTFELRAGSTVGDESTSELTTILTSDPVGGDHIWRVSGTVARFGSTLVLISNTDVQPVGTQPQLTDSEWQTIVDKATAKIAALDAG